MSCRICAWMVTSSAVVGSSAISTAGRHASAMAIITRWRRPPLSWNGKSRTRCSWSGTPTEPSRRAASAYASRLPRPRCSRSTSAIW